MLRGIESLIRLTSVRGVLHSRVSWKMYLGNAKPGIKGSYRDGLLTRKGKDDDRWHLVRVELVRRYAFHA